MQGASKLDQIDEMEESEDEVMNELEGKSPSKGSNSTKNKQAFMKAFTNRFNRLVNENKQIG